MIAAGPLLDTGLLLLGYGNTLRGDDAVGPVLAERIQALNLPGVRVLICQVLTPELAAPISKSAKVVFVDATVDGSLEVKIRRVEPADSARVAGHTADPRVLLALARDLFGFAPEAWWLTIPVDNLELREGLSARAALGVEQAIRALESLRLLPGLTL